ncbi:MAG TPA: GNAT family N-acetyltransferase [Candidatus Binatia bacterium]|nr:GNAT family N-acetyltransferase [Candidatus Binatia bacterium]
MERIDEVDPTSRRVAVLFDAHTPNALRLRATLAGVCRGRVIVDDARRPSQALLRTSYSTTFLGGAVTRDFVEAAIAGLRPAGDVRLITRPGDELGPLLPPDDDGYIARLEFGTRDPAVALAPLVRSLPRGHRLQWIDALTLTDCLWRGEMAKAFGTIARFLRHGVGVCVRRGDEIVAEAYGMYPTDGQMELAVVTKEAYRGRRLATAACAFLLRHLESRGIATSWSCYEANVRSITVARRLGFAQPEPYRLMRYDAPRMP